MKSHIEIIQTLSIEFQSLNKFLEDNYQAKNTDKQRNEAIDRQREIQRMVLILTGCHSLSDSPLYWGDELRNLTEINQVKLHEWLKS